MIFILVPIAALFIILFISNVVTNARNIIITTQTAKQRTQLVVTVQENMKVTHVP